MTTAQDLITAGNPEAALALLQKQVVQYRPQTSTGGKGGAFVFQDEVLPGG